MESTMRDEQQAPYTVTDREDRYDSPEPYTAKMTGEIRRGRPSPYPTEFDGALGDAVTGAYIEDVEPTPTEEQQAPYEVDGALGELRGFDGAYIEPMLPQARSLADLRRDLVEARAYLRHAERQMPVIKAEAEYRIISAQYDGDAKQLGVNEAD